METPDALFFRLATANARRRREEKEDSDLQSIVCLLTARQEWQDRSWSLIKNI